MEDERNIIEVELPPIMTQRLAVIDCLFELAGASGNLYIAEKPVYAQSEMSPALRKKLEDLTQQLREFNELFIKEF